MNEAVMKIMDEELAKLPHNSYERGCYLDNFKDRYYELLEKINTKGVEDELYEMVEKDYSPEALEEALKNPNEW